jgi:hypothetical protein
MMPARVLEAARRHFGAEDAADRRLEEARRRGWSREPRVYF